MKQSNITSIDDYYFEHILLEEGLRDFLDRILDKLVSIVKGEQKAFLRKLSREKNKNQKVRMLNRRIEELASNYIQKFSQERRSKNLEKMIDLEKDIIELLKLYETINGKKHKRDVHRKTGLFDRVFLWPELLEKGVTKRDLQEQYEEKVNSIRTRANRKIKRAEEELEYFMKILPN
jgi:Trp operon repressor